MMMAEPLPLWLQNWTPGRPIHASDFFAARVVFYPGSGTDGQPVKYFGAKHVAHSFVFADYGITKNEVLRELEPTGHPFEGYESAGYTEVQEQDLTPYGWIPHIHPSNAPRQSITPGQTYAFIAVLERRPEWGNDHGPKRLAIMFICADGVAAYDALFCQQEARAPFAVVLQDHGFGGNWTTFGRGGGLEQVASTAGRFPELLLVATNTEAWVNYSMVSGAEAIGGGMHNFTRQLWRRTPHSGDNPIETVLA